MTDSKTNEKKWLIFLSLALLMGAALRLAFPGDIEYKEDEKFMFEASQNIGRSQAWPMLGMTSGVGVNNPGMSVWVFVVLARIFHADTPPELAQAVQWLNILGLCVLAFFSFRLLPEAEREPWRWATALASVNPFAVLFKEKSGPNPPSPFFACSSGLAGVTGINVGAPSFGDSLEFAWDKSTCQDFF